jgi:2-C-methyl-D-erythritol 4-phosphate cytidylyltransferase
MSGVVTGVPSSWGDAGPTTQRLPKQYLPVAGRPLIYHALAALCSVSRVVRVFVALAPGDTLWGNYDWSDLDDKLRPLFCGGATRAESVANGLAAMTEEVMTTDWVLVHDAVRPCVLPSHIDALIDGVGDADCGGILAVPASDTLKRADATGRIAATIMRKDVWQAQTPQMFRHGDLCRALAENRDVTDEAAAMEALGLNPKLVEADRGNLKVTYPFDLQLAEWILQHRAKAHAGHSRS